MGFVRIFWKNNVQEAYLPKMSISGQIVSEMLTGYTKKKIKKVEFSKYNWATNSGTIWPKMLIISEISFLWRHTLVLYCFVLNKFRDTAPFV